MKIKGLQKTTFIDYPGKTACTIFLFGCNFRCGFCHNPGLVLKDDEGGYSEEEFFDFLDSKKKYLEGVCITGGEPFVSLDLEFLRKIKERGFAVKIDTNGSFPDKLKKAIDLKLVDFISMDLKNSKERYSETAGVDVMVGDIEKSIKTIFDFGSYEFRTTILESLHTKEDIESLGKWVNRVCGGKPKRYFLQGFKCQGKLIDDSFSSVANTRESYLNELKEIAEKYFKEVGVRV